MGQGGRMNDCPQKRMGWPTIRMDIPILKNWSNDHSNVIVTHSFSTPEPFTYPSNPPENCPRMTLRVMMYFYAFEVAPLGIHLFVPCKNVCLCASEGGSRRLIVISTTFDMIGNIHNILKHSLHICKSKSSTLRNIQWNEWSLGNSNLNTNGHWEIQNWKRMAIGIFKNDKECTLKKQKRMAIRMGSNPFECSDEWVDPDSNRSYPFIFSTTVVCYNHPRAHRQCLQVKLLSPAGRRLHSKPRTNRTDNEIARSARECASMSFNRCALRRLFAASVRPTSFGSPYSDLS